MSLFSDVVQHPVSDVLGGSHTLSLYCYVYDEDENGRQIPVSASLVVTRRSSTDEVEFTGHITIGGGGSFALSATSGGKGPSDSIEFTVGDEIFFDARDEEEEEEDNFQECQESLGRNDWMDHCRDVVVTNLQGSDVEPSVIEQWCDKAKSCRDDEMGEEKLLNSALDLLLAHCPNVALNIILSFVALHPATYIVILWIRSSPPFIVACFYSQWARLLIAYRLWRKKSDRNILLLPIRVEGRGRIGWGTEDWPKYHQVIRLIKRIGNQGKTPVLLMNCISRLCRNPFRCADMVREVRSGGGVVLTLRQWNTDFSRLPLIVFAWTEWMTLQGSVRSGGATAIRPLRADRLDEITAIGETGRELILREGTQQNKFVIEAALASVKAANENSSLVDSVSAILTRDRLVSLQGGVDGLKDIKRKVDGIFGDLERIRPLNKSDDSPLMILQFTRTSPCTRTDVLEVTEDLLVAATQCAINNHAIEKKVGTERLDEFDHIILPLHHVNRRSVVTPEYILMLALILSGKVHMVVMTVTTRASGHLGYVLLLMKVCEATKTELVFSQYIHSEDITGEDLAVAEQVRYDAELKAYESYIDTCDTICRGDSLFSDMCQLAASALGRIGKPRGSMLRGLMCEEETTETDADAKKPPASARGAKPSSRRISGKRGKRKSVFPEASAALPPPERRSLRTRKVVRNYASNDDKDEAME